MDLTGVSVCDIVNMGALNQKHVWLGCVFLFTVDEYKSSGIYVHSLVGFTVERKALMLHYVRLMFIFLQ